MATTFPGDAMSPPQSHKVGIAPRFCVEVKTVLLASFTECSGLSATVRSDKWEEGGANHTTLKFPGRTDFGNLTLKHGVSYSTELFEWFMDVLRGKNVRQDISILIRGQDLSPLMNQKDQPVGWHFLRAFPVKWTGPTLQATANSVAIESIEFAHDGFVGV